MKTIELSNEECAEIAVALLASREHEARILQYQGVPLEALKKLPSRLRMIDGILKKVGLTQKIDFLMESCKGGVYDRF